MKLTHYQPLTLIDSRLSLLTPSSAFCGRAMLHRVPLLQTDALPTLCDRSRCFASRAPGSRFCAHHARKGIGRPQEERKPQPVSGDPSLFVILGQQGFKFGCACDVDLRIKRIARELRGAEPSLHGRMPGSPWLAEAIIRRLRPYRLPGEWFAAAPETLRISDLVRAGDRLALERLTQI